MILEGLNVLYFPFLPFRVVSPYMGKNSVQRPSLKNGERARRYDSAQRL